jgi:hypothetical protein
MIWGDRNMSALYGYLSGDRPGTATKAAHRFIEAKVQTWADRLSLCLGVNGNFELFREPGPNGAGPRICIASGNLDDLGRITTDCEVG